MARSSCLATLFIVALYSIQLCVIICFASFVSVAWPHPDSLHGWKHRSWMAISTSTSGPGPRLADAFCWLVGWIHDRPELMPPDFRCMQLDCSPGALADIEEEQLAGGGTESANVPHGGSELVGSTGSSPRPAVGHASLSPLPLSSTEMEKGPSVSISAISSASSPLSSPAPAPAPGLSSLFAVGETTAIASLECKSKAGLAADIEDCHRAACAAEETFYADSSTGNLASLS